MGISFKTSNNIGATGATGVECHCCGVRGCVHPNASNYIPSNTIDDGSCVNGCGCPMGLRIITRTPNEDGTTDVDISYQVESTCVEGEDGMWPGTCPVGASGATGASGSFSCCPALFSPCQDMEGCTGIPVGSTGATGATGLNQCECLYAGCPPNASFSASLGVGSLKETSKKAVECSAVADAFIQNNYVWEGIDVMGLIGNPTSLCFATFVEKTQSDGEEIKRGKVPPLAIPAEKISTDPTCCVECGQTANCLQQTVSCTPECPPGIEAGSTWFQYLCCGRAISPSTPVVDEHCLEYAPDIDPITGKVKIDPRTGQEMEKCVSYAYVTTQTYTEGVTDFESIPCGIFRCGSATSGGPPVCVNVTCETETVGSCA